MRTQTRLVAVALSLALPVAVSAAPLDSVQVRRWREDLAVLRTEMPAKHPNLFHAMTPAQFDSALQSIDRSLPRLARHQVIVELQKLDALVGDGHSNVSPWRDTAAAFHQLPVALYWFEDGLFVRAATQEQAALVGARVVGIGGATVDEAIARVRPLISRDNEMGVRAWAPVLLTMPEVLHAIGLATDPTRATFRLETAGGRREVELASAGLFPMLTGETDLTWMKRPGWVDARDRAPAPLWLSNPQNKYWYRLLPRSRSLYCQINAIQQKADDSLDVFLARALHAADSARAERFILDLRLNGGGDGTWNRDIVRSLLKSRYDGPGRLLVITGRRTWSAAQMLINELENIADVEFVGEPSASRGNVYGDSKKIVLPNSGVTVRVSSLYWQQSDPRDTREFIGVNVPATLTYAQYAAGRDPALEAAEGGGELVARAYTDSLGTVHTVLRSGADRVATHRARYRDARASTDGHAYGALLISSIDTDPPHHAMAEVCRKLVVWRDGKELRPVAAGEFIRDWGFWKDGAQVAIYSGALHFAGHFDLLDLASGKVLASSEDPVTDGSPPWVRALDH